MRNFRQFQTFCYTNRNEYRFLAFKGAFDRVASYREYNRNGHYKQLFYAIYDFYSANPTLISRAGVPAFEIMDNPVFFEAWDNFIHNDNNDADGFNTDSLKKNLSLACGGHRQGGGGWSPIAKVLFPTVAVYMLE